MEKKPLKWLNWRNGISLGVGLVVLGIAIALATGQLKAGIGGGETVVTSEKTTVGGIETTTTTTPQEAKTLWDLFNLAGVVAVPIVLGILGFRLQAQQQKQNEAQKQRELEQAEKLADTQREQTEKLAAVEREQTEKLAAVEREIAEQNRQEEALQNYYDKVSALLVDKNLLAIAAKGDTATTEEKELLNVSGEVIRARTLATLRRLDKTRRDSLIQFLSEAEIISELRLNLKGAHLSQMNLNGINLKGTDLSETDLSKIHLTGANLTNANLTGANLDEVNFSKAVLRGANLALSTDSPSTGSLIGANLSVASCYMHGINLRGRNLIGVNLQGKHLTEACLRDADLSEANLMAADLSKADLSYTNLSKANLRKAKLFGAGLRGAKLLDANLRDTDLRGADLRDTKLGGADLTDADLREADLSYADLSGALGLTKEQFFKKSDNDFSPCLCKTKLPEGIDVDSDRDCNWRLRLLQETEKEDEFLDKLIERDVERAEEDMMKLQDELEKARNIKGQRYYYNYQAPTSYGKVSENTVEKLLKELARKSPET